MEEVYNELYLCCKYNAVVRLGSIKAQYHTIDLNKRDTNSMTSLMYAIDNNNPEIIKVLMRFCVDINMLDNNGWNALMYACKRGNLGFVEYVMIDSLSDYNNYNGDGRTCISYACEEGHVEIVSILLQRNDINITRPSNDHNLYCKRYTPLMFAVANNHIEIVSLLLAKYKELSINDYLEHRNYYDKTALDIAKDKGYTEIISLLDQVM